MLASKIYWREDVPPVPPPPPPPILMYIASISPGLPGTVPPDGLLPLSRYGFGIVPEVQLE